ncbi:MAG: hypothetical protein NUW01_13265 [Gemmatimonadaceae bacterium]|nr:hypothetical protein [Gemmatimonadaceae bacterium]
MAFTFAYRLGGGSPTVAEFFVKDTETLTVGDLVNVESGEVDLGATNDTDFAGVLVGVAPGHLARMTNPGVISGVDSTTKVRVIIDRDAVYSVADSTARAAGATLDIAGATGAMTIATSSSVDVVCVETSTAAEPTLVMIADGEHYLDA